nr:unnamed protein product [Callosobruchus chinensis]
MPDRIQQTYLQKGSKYNLTRMTESGIVKLAKQTVCDPSIVKRERDRKLLNKLTVQRMREELPVYTMQEIRLHRMPYWDAQMVELQEKGYRLTIEHLNKIFELEKRNDQLILKNSRNELEKLFNCLQMYEMYLKQDDTSKACREFLKGAVYFAFLGKEWWWLGDQLLLDSIDYSSTYVHRKCEAFSRFSYAKFKIENLKDFVNVEEHLLVAKDLSAAEPWVAKELFQDMKDTLFMQVSLLLYLCFIRKAKHFANTHPEEALVFAIQAKRNAGAACCKIGEMEASLVKASCELNLNRPREAIATLNCTLTQQTSRKSYEGMCKVKSALVKAHLCNKDVDTAFLKLNDLRELTTKYGFQVYLSVAYKTLGEYYLEQGEPHIADPFITEALLILESYDINMYADIIIMRNLEAITKGLELMPEYIKHIRQAGEPGPNQEDSVSVLVDWKNERKPFWSYSDHCGRKSTTQKSRDLLHDTSKPIKPHDLMDASTKLINVEKKLARLLVDQSDTPVVELMPKKEVASSASASEINSSPHT